MTTDKLHAQYEIMFSNNYPPYNYLNDKGELVGFNVDILNAIKDIYKTDIQITSGEWNVINDALNSNKIDAIGGIHFPGSFDPNFIYTRSAINTSHCFLYNSKFHNKFSLEYIRTLKEPLIVMWEHDVLIHYIKSINPSAKFLFITNYTDFINAIDREDVSGLFGQRICSMYYAEKLNKDYVEPLDHRILERSMGFKVSKEDTALAAILNNGLEVILANGEYQKIFDNSLAEYDKNSNNWRIYFKYIVLISGLILLVIILLVVVNRVLQNRVRSKTEDLRKQLALNSQIMEELEEQKNKAEESDKIKTAFLANMSHEIRTPMNGILGFAELLKNTDYSSEKHAKFISIIQQSGHRMLDTINNIIEVSKLESGIEKPIIKEVTIKNILNELYNFFHPEAALKGLSFVFKETDSTIYQPFYTDEYKLNSILTNLIKNALKFTKKGGIEVSYALHNNYAEFWIKDTGIGISQDKQATIFEQFVQADFSHTSGFEGSGLGLSICKGYVHLLKGHITLESEPNEGSTFYVRIPNNINSQQLLNKTTQKVIPEQSILEKYNILIAEDDEISFVYLESVLEDIIANLYRAKDGLTAVELAKRTKVIDLIFMDIKMPQLNGFEATEEIRKFNKDVIIIAQSAFTQENYKQRAKDAGCNAFISKPVNKQKLLALISKVIKEKVNF
ncbi:MULTISPECIES: ATP-binding protein [Flavobacteriaceae]|uniref:histidine kinase n=1 Tax=Lutibacter litoralis TaxID=321268 RepID=A0ABV5K1M3_9FLAO|nr:MULTISPECIES: ATP-binding protein [Flavobacteriaceae]